MSRAWTPRAACPRSRPPGITPSSTPTICEAAWRRSPRGADHDLRLRRAGQPRERDRSRIADRELRLRRRGTGHGQTLPGGSQIGLGYDADGNVTSVTPPGRPAHTFTVSPAGLVEEYDPPDVGLAEDRTRYTYDEEKRLTRVDRPDGTAVAYGYDRFGRLATITDPSGTRTLAYDATTGNLASIAAPGGTALTYGYDGGLLTAIDRSGPLAGSIRLHL